MNRLSEHMASAIRPVYDRVRPYLPRRLGSLNNVAVRRPRLFDATDVDKNYKKALIDATRSYAKDGDTVINIGGGAGVSTVVAARQVGPTGSVITYEGGSEWVDLCREAADINHVEDIVDVKHCVVGTDVGVWGEPGDTISPCDLPSAEMLIMDCEGAEMLILEQLDQTPDVVIVEVHPSKGIDVAEVPDLLLSQGYQIRTERNPDGGYARNSGNPVVVGTLAD